MAGNEQVWLRRLREVMVWMEVVQQADWSGRLIRCDSSRSDSIEIASSGYNQCTTSL
ncbi:hypothetical protein KIN20_008139 [Parelaphostrongylus tenuis]|uniref:Uncharacterized protein n=1 Tax=Parelaphostrongylus tenuis TaxID=148309 RepID=A0AAD5QIK2_PARTN|nr:hypothetical protein KIN20_008139 [Parelaphostrongylus tenuis]